MGSWFRAQRADSSVGSALGFRVQTYLECGLGLRDQIVEDVVKGSEFRDAGFGIPKVRGSGSSSRMLRVR